MVEPVEDRHGTVPDTAPEKRPRRLFPDTLPQGLRDVSRFTLRFLGWCARWSLATLVFIAVMISAGYFVFNQSVKGGGYILVPDVSGLHGTRAANVLAEAGLELGVQKQVVTDRVPEYHVLVQRPRANSVVRAGRKVSLTIRAGSEFEITPTLVGKTLEEALRQIAGTRLKAGSVARLPGDTPADVILAQDPEARSPIAVGEEIHLLVSSGPESLPLFMPNIVGTSLEKVQITLAKLKLPVVPYAVDRPGDEYEVVLQQDPPPGTLLRDGQEVSFDIRLLPSSFLPNAHRKVDIVYTVPQTTSPAAISVEIVDQAGVRTLIYPEKRDYIQGRPPRIDAGTTITFEDLPVSSKATVEFFVDGALHASYYYLGSKEPVVTINDLGTTGPRTPDSPSLVHQEDLDVPPPSVRRPFGGRRNLPNRRRNPQ